MIEFYVYDCFAKEIKFGVRTQAIRVQLCTNQSIPITRDGEVLVVVVHAMNRTCLKVYR